MWNAIIQLSDKTQCFQLFFDCCLMNTEGFGQFWYDWVRFDQELFQGVKGVHILPSVSSLRFPKQSRCIIVNCILPHKLCRTRTTHNISWAIYHLSCYSLKCFCRCCTIRITVIYAIYILLVIMSCWTENCTFRTFALTQHEFLILVLLLELSVKW